jgi:hypothetical protein
LAERKRIQTDLNKCRESIDRILNQALDEIFDPATVRAKVAEIRLRQDQLQDARKRLERNASTAVDEGLLLLELAQDLPRAFRDSSPEQRAKLVRLLFKKAVVLDGRLNFTPNEVFGPL